MTTPDLPEDKALIEIQAALAKTSVSTKRKVVEKFVLAALSSIPWVGGFISAAASRALMIDVFSYAVISGPCGTAELSVTLAALR